MSEPADARTNSSMPAVFLGHGSPMNALEANRYTAAWRTFGQTVPKPRAILAISAHWYVNATAVTAMARPRTIHDFFGFPQELFVERQCLADFPFGDAPNGESHVVEDVVAGGDRLVDDVEANGSSNTEEIHRCRESIDLDDPSGNAQTHAFTTYKERARTIAP